VDKAPSNVWNWASDRTTPPDAVMFALGFVAKLEAGVGGKKAGLFGSVEDQAEGLLGGLVP
jgi:hypothetical protein